MKKTYLPILAILTLLQLTSSCSHEPANQLKIGEFRNIQTMERTIDVTGSADKKINADEIVFAIGIQEYYEEEYRNHTTWQDYKTKVPIHQIEKKLFSKLDAIGINRKDITVESIGDLWGGEGRTFNQSKNYTISIKDFELIDKLASIEQFKGLQYVRVQELKNKQLKQIREQLKIEALKAAKEKARYLVESLGKNLGDVVYIGENMSGINNNSWYYNQQKTSNVSFNSTAGSTQNEQPSYKSIQMTCEIQATFEIK